MDISQVVKKLYEQGITKKFCFVYQIEGKTEILCTNTPQKIEERYKNLITGILQKEIKAYEFCFLKRQPDGSYQKVSKNAIRD